MRTASTRALGQEDGWLEPREGQSRRKDQRGKRWKARVCRPCRPPNRRTGSDHRALQLLGSGKDGNERPGRWFHTKVMVARTRVERWNVARMVRSSCILGKCW